MTQTSIKSMYFTHLQTTVYVIKVMVTQLLMVFCSSINILVLEKFSALSISVY